MAKDSKNMRKEAPGEDRMVSSGKGIVLNKKGGAQKKPAKDTGRRK